MSVDAPPRLLFVVTEDWYFWSHRLPIARAARDAGFEVHVATRVSEHGDRIRAERFQLHPLGWRRRGFSIFGEIGTLVALWRLYRTLRPRIIHHIAIKPVLFGSIVARLARCQSVINSINGLGLAFTSQGTVANLRRALLRLLFYFGADRAANLMIMQNDDDRQTLHDRGFVSRSRTCIIRGSGIDTEEYQPLPEPEGTPTIATVTRMLSIKGVADVVQASRILLSRGLSHRLLLVGSSDPGNPSSIPSKTLESWASEPNIEFRGFVTDVRTIWRDSHIAVLASHGGEGLPKSLLEAAACGRPLIATDVPGCREIVRRDVTGILVRPRDPEMLADAMQQLINDRAMRIRFGNASRHVSASEFADNVVVASLMSVYRDRSNWTMLDTVEIPKQ